MNNDKSPASNAGQNLGPVDPNSFPDGTIGATNKPKLTLANANHLLSNYDVGMWFDAFKKEIVFDGLNVCGVDSNSEKQGRTVIKSLANLNGMPVGLLDEFIDTLASQNVVNPIKNWIESKPWDGEDRLPKIYATLVTEEEFPTQLKQALIRKWLLSAAAAVFDDGFKSRGVLTLQGAQGLGKTSWIEALVPAEGLRDRYVISGLSIDPRKQDDVLSAIKHWIVEMGELESTFKRDLPALKAFLTNSFDFLRLVYQRQHAEFKRRTVFAASVNDANFLVDQTGNNRFWVLPLTEIDYQHGIDMQQLFAQLKAQLNGGEKWWLNIEEERALDLQNRKHRALSVVEDLLLQAVDMDRVGEIDLPMVTPRKCLEKVGIDDPTNAQFKECNAFLREYFGQPKRYSGINKWPVPFKSELEIRRMK